MCCPETNTVFDMLPFQRGIFRVKGVLFRGDGVRYPGGGRQGNLMVILSPPQELLVYRNRLRLCKIAFRA